MFCLHDLSYKLFWDSFRRLLSNKLDKHSNLYASSIRKGNINLARFKGLERWHAWLFCNPLSSYIGFMSLRAVINERLKANKILGTLPMGIENHVDDDVAECGLL